MVAYGRWLFTRGGRYERVDCINPQQILGEHEKKLVNHTLEASDLQAFQLSFLPCFIRKISQPELFSLFCMENKPNLAFLSLLQGKMSQPWLSFPEIVEKTSLSSSWKNEPTTPFFLVLYGKNKSKSALFSIL